MYVVYVLQNLDFYKYDGELKYFSICLSDLHKYPKVQVMPWKSKLDMLIYLLPPIPPIWYPPTSGLSRETAAQYEMEIQFAISLTSTCQHRDIDVS